MIFYLIFFILLLAPLIWATARRKDAFPFSHYPMFSHLIDTDNVVVYRVALETKDGNTVWWKSGFYRYPEFVGRKLKNLYELEHEHKQLFFTLERQRLLIEVLRLIEVEAKDAEKYKAFQIVKRIARKDKHNKLKIKDETLAVIPFEEIRKIRRDN